MLSLTTVRKTTKRYFGGSASCSANQWYFRGKWCRVWQNGAGRRTSPGGVQTCRVLAFMSSCKIDGTDLRSLTAGPRAFLRTEMYQWHFVPMACHDVMMPWLGLPTSTSGDQPPCLWRSRGGWSWLWLTGPPNERCQKSASCFLGAKRQRDQGAPSLLGGLYQHGRHADMLWQLCPTDSVVACHRTHMCCPWSVEEN